MKIKKRTLYIGIVGVVLLFLLMGLSALSTLSKGTANVDTPKEVKESKPIVQESKPSNEAFRNNLSAKDASLEIINSISNILPIMIFLTLGLALIIPIIKIFRVWKDGY